MWVRPRKGKDEYTRVCENVNAAESLFGCQFIWAFDACVFVTVKTLEVACAIYVPYHLEWSALDIGMLNTKSGNALYDADQARGQ